MKTLASLLFCTLSVFGQYSPSTAFSTTAAAEISVKPTITTGASAPVGNCTAPGVVAGSTVYKDLYFTTAGVGYACTSTNTWTPLPYDPSGAATASTTSSAQRASNLADLASASTARTNLGLGTASVMVGPSGTIVGTTDAQTLTNKSIAGSEVNTGTLPHAQLPTILSGDIPNNAANTSGNSGTATALASTPTLCSSGQAPTGVLANGNATGCAAISGGSANSMFTGSTAATTSSGATPQFSLADVSVKSPVRFNISPIVNVTGPTIINKTAGATFYIAVTSDGTHTWTWNSIVSDGVCPIYTAGAATTTAELQIDADGSTVHGLSCVTSINGLLFSGAVVSASATNPGAGNIDARMTAHGLDSYDGTTHWVQVQPNAGSAHNFATAVSVGGVISEAQPAFTDVSGSVASTQMPALTGDCTTSAGAVAVTCGTVITRTIVASSVSLGTSAIASTACTLITATATGALTTDSVTSNPSGDITGVTGYVPLTSGTLTIYPPWLTSGQFNVKICNLTSSSVTPGAVTLLFRVTR